MVSCWLGGYMLLLVCLLGIQCYAMEPSRHDNVNPERGRVVSAVDLDANEIARIHAKSANMLMFHIAYSYYCDAQDIGEQSFFDIYERYDPATPENGNKGIRERYEAWLRKVGITEMHKPGTPIGNGDDWDELLRRSDAI